MATSHPPFSVMASSSFFSSPVLTIVLINPKEKHTENPNKRKRSTSSGLEESQEKRVQQDTIASTGGENAVREVGEHVTVEGGTVDVVLLDVPVHQTVPGAGTGQTITQTVEVESIQILDEAASLVTVEPTQVTENTSFLDTNTTSQPQPLESQSQSQTEQSSLPADIFELEASTPTQPSLSTPPTINSETETTVTENHTPATPDTLADSEASTPSALAQNTINGASQPGSNQDETFTQAVAETMGQVVEAIANVAQVVDGAVTDAAGEMIEHVMNVMDDATFPQATEATTVAHILREAIEVTVAEGLENAGEVVQHVVEEATGAMVEDIAEDSSEATVETEATMDENAVEETVGEASGAMVEDAVQEATGAMVESIVGDATEAMVVDSVEEAVGETAEAMVVDSVEQAVEDTVEGATETMVEVVVGEVVDENDGSESMNLDSDEQVVEQVVEEVAGEAVEAMVVDSVEQVVEEGVGVAVQDVLVTSDGQLTTTPVETVPEAVATQPTTTETTSETAAPTVQLPRIEPTYQLHISVLIAHSDYFKSLISFNGLEVSQGRVNFESPAAYSFSEDITKVAFGCFIDYIYTGDYNLSGYQVGEDKHKIMFMPEQMTYHSAVYVLAERLLSDGLKHLAIKKLYALIYNYHFKKYHKPTPIPNLTSEEMLIYSHNNSKTIKEPWWPHFDLTVRIAFNGTFPRGSLPPPIPLPPANPALPPRTADSPIQASESVTRSTWLTGDHLRNLLGAFFASIWPSSFDKKGSISEAGMAGRKRLAENAELLQLIIAYLANPRTTFMFGSYPLRDFGITEEERTQLGCARPTFRSEQCPGGH